MAKKKKENSNRDPVTLRVPKDLLERIDKLVEQSDLDRTAYIVELLKDAINQDLILKEEKVIRRITKPREPVFDEPNETFEEIWTYTIPLVGAVAAGKPITATVEEELRVAQDYPGDHVAYRVCGDSMTLPNGNGIPDGSTIVVRHFEEPRSPGNNRIYVFQIGGELTLKRFVRGKKGAPHQLVCNNPEHPPVEPDENTGAIGEFVEVLSNANPKQ